MTDTPTTSPQIPEQMFVCPVCHLHYDDEALMKRCQDWCETQASCNLEVAKQSLEAREAQT